MAYSLNDLSCQSIVLMQAGFPFSNLSQGKIDFLFIMDTFIANIASLPLGVFCESYPLKELMKQYYDDNVLKIN